MRTLQNFGWLVTMPECSWHQVGNMRISSLIPITEGLIPGTSKQPLTSGGLKNTKNIPSHSVPLTKKFCKRHTSKKIFKALDIV